jgi:hypothetical protein
LQMVVSLKLKVQAKRSMGFVILLWYQTAIIVAPSDDCKLIQNKILKLWKN